MRSPDSDPSERGRHLDRELIETVGRLIDLVRRDLDDNRCHLVLREELLADLAGLAGVAHSARALERLAHECSEGDELILRLIARHHIEAVVATLYLHFGGKAALDRLMGSYKFQFEQWARVVEQNNERITKARRRAAKRNRSIRQKNDQLVQHFGEDAIDLIEAVAIADSEPIDLDAWNRLLAEAEEIESEELPFEQLVKEFVRIAPVTDGAVRDDAEGVNTIYSVVYRSLSTLGAHPGLWTFERYLNPAEMTCGVDPVAKVPSMARGCLHSAAAWTAWAAQVVFERRGLDTSEYDEILEELGVAEAET